MRKPVKPTLAFRKLQLMLWLKARKFKVGLVENQWRDYWHTHFDWDGAGNSSRLLRRLYLQAMLRAMGTASRDLKGANRPAQVFLVLDVNDSASDGLYIHTPNPNHTPFPYRPNGTELGYIPALLAGLVDRKHHVIHLESSENGPLLTVQLKSQVLKHAAFPASA